MSDLNNKYFINRYQFWKYLEPYCNGLDFNMTLRHKMGCIKLLDEEGTIFTKSSVEFFDILNDKFKLKLESKLSHYQKDRCTIFWKGDSIKKSVKDLIETIEVEDVKEETLLISLDPVVEELKEEEEEVLEIEPTKVKSVDWEWIESLGNTKEGKLALDEYASEFGASLNRVKKIENMIADFKDFLEEV